jgi:hypothetical protein
LATALVKAHFDAAQGEQLVVAAGGDEIGAARLADLLHARLGHARVRDLLVGVAGPHCRNDELAAVVGEHRRAGGEALIVVIGSPIERRVIERELRTDRDVGISVMLLVDALDGADLARVRRKVAGMIVSRGQGLLRDHPTLSPDIPSFKPDIARQMEHRAALRLGLRVALVADPKRGAARMKATHARLVADTASMADAPLDPKTVGLVTALGLLSPLWRIAAGRLTGLVPLTRIVVRGVLAYSVTRLVGIGAQRVAMHGRAPHQEER